MVDHYGKNLAFIFCLPRSGSTLLSLLLNGHPSICCPPEPWFLLKLLTMDKQVNEYSIYDDQFATIGMNEFFSDETLKNSKRAFASTAYNGKLSEYNKSIIIDKTPRYYHIIDEIDNIFPDAKKIFLVRNPLDIALSYKKTWHITPDKLTGKNLTCTFDFSYGLFKLYDYFKIKSPNKYIIKYEDLVDNPRKNIEDICSFLDVKFEENMDNINGRQIVFDDHKKSTMGDKKIFSTNIIHNESKNKGIYNLKNKELEKLLSVIGIEIFDNLGYGDDIDFFKKNNISSPDEKSAANLRKKIMGKEVKLKKLKILANNLLEKFYLMT